LSRVYWTERTTLDLPTGNDWLSALELSQFQKFRFEKRRTDWRLGRWTAKQAVTAYLQVEPRSEVLAAIEILPSAAGAPDVVICNQPAPIKLSLSHSNGRALCALTLAGIRLGCDIERVEPRTAGFVSDYFTSHEQSQIEQLPGSDRHTVITMFWSAKESALKALGEGLRLDTRSVNVIVNEVQVRTGTLSLCSDFSASMTQKWLTLEVATNNGTTFPGRWRQSHGFVTTIVADARPDTPTPSEVVLPGLL